MLGDIVRGLTDPSTAEQTLALVTQGDLRERIDLAAAGAARSVGVVVADRIGQLLDGGDEGLWMDLLTTMAGSPQPGAAAINRILALAFPDPVRVRITRHA